MQDSKPLVDQHAGRREAFEEHAVGDLTRSRALRCRRGGRRLVAATTVATIPDQRKVDDVVPGRPDPAVDPPTLRHRLEQLFLSRDRFGRAEKQVAVRLKCEMKQRQHPLLHRRLEIDQEVAADDEVEPREGRVLQQVLRREGDRLADLPLDAVGVVLRVEEALEPLGADVLVDARGINAGAGGGQHGCRDVGREEPQVQVLALLGHRLGEQHGKGVGLLAGGATGEPNPNGRAGGALAHQWLDDLPGERLPGFGVAKEAGDVDGQIGQQRRQLVLVVLQELDVVVERCDPLQPHAAADPAEQRVLAIAGEILARPGPHEREQ